MNDRDLTKTYGRAQCVDKLRPLADAIESQQAFFIQVARCRIPDDHMAPSETNAGTLGTSFSSPA